VIPTQLKKPITDRVTPVSRNHAERVEKTNKNRLPLPFLTRLLGKRRSWMLLAQVGIAAGLMILAELDPVSQIELIAVTAVI
jgi:hypothetical protein